MKQDLIYYLQQQIRNTSERLLRFTHDLSGNQYPVRLMYGELSPYIKDFLDKKSNNSMVIMPGFRGVGKTTLMAQLCTEFKSQVKHSLFVSIEDVKNLFDVGIAELLVAYEEIIGIHLENLKEPLLIFLDEIQMDLQWASTLKSLFEKTRYIFFCCTGSSAVILQTTTNLARRAIFKTLPPMNFTEYQMVKNNIKPVVELNEKIQQAIYFSKNSDEVFKGLTALKSSVNAYWTNIDRMDIKRFFSYGTLPFALTMPNEVAIYDSISLLLDKIIKIDLPTLGHFTIETLNMVKRLLFVIAENDVTSLATLEKIFSMSRHTIASILDALEKAEVLIKVPAYGSNMSVAKKAHKYLFMSPAIRMTFFYMTGLESTYLTRQGKLLEDIVGAQLYRDFILKGQGAIRYDSEEGGADFILQILNHKQIIMEVGVGDKDKKQVVSSMKKINSDYNLIFSSSPLKIEKEAKIVFIPLDFFLLL